MTDENSVVPTQSSALTKQQQDQIDRAVPQILQQIDPKVLIQFLKSSGNNAQVNVVSIGHYYSGGRTEGNSIDNGTLHVENEQLRQKNEQLEAKLKNARDFGIVDWLEGLPQPRHEFMIREVVIALKGKFETQKECASYLGVTPRVFSYWMMTYNIPGYKPNQSAGSKRGKKKEK
jgi:hypothetical protein